MLTKQHGRVQPSTTDVGVRMRRVIGVMEYSSAYISKSPVVLLPA